MKLINVLLSTVPVHRRLIQRWGRSNNGESETSTLVRSNLMHCVQFMRAPRCAVRRRGARGQGIEMMRAVQCHVLRDMSSARR